MVLSVHDIEDILEGSSEKLRQLLHRRNDFRLSVIEHCAMDARILRKLHRRDTYRYKFNQYILRHPRLYLSMPVGNCLPYGWDENGAVDTRFHPMFKVPNMGIILEAWTMERNDWDTDSEVGNSS